MQALEAEAQWVLAVEDDPVYQGLLRAWLSAEEAGYRLLVAGDLAAAREALRRRRFDLVLLDLTLPDSSGLQTLHAVQLDGGGAPVVVLTGLEDEALGLEAVRHGAQGFIPKSGADPLRLKRELRYAVERRRLEELHRRALLHEMEVRRLQEIDQAKTRFLESAARGLRRPLQPLRMGFDMLDLDLRRRLDPEQRDTLDSLRRSLDDLERLVGDLVDVAGLQTGTLELHRRPVDLARIVQEARGDWGAVAAHNRLECRWSVQAGLLVEADARRLRQVLDHVLHNAVRSTPGGGVVRVDLARQGGDAVLQVQDTGVGIHPDRLPHVFEAFRAAGEDSDGHGLGLAFSKTVVERHGGRIEVQSDGLGLGATVRVALPLLGGIE